MILLRKSGAHGVSARCEQICMLLYQSHACQAWIFVPHMELAQMPNQAIFEYLLTFSSFYYAKRCEQFERVHQNESSQGTIQ